MNRTIKKYNRFSRAYDLLERPIEKYLFSNLRKKVIAHTEGKVLEVGIGTGKNMPYYPKNVEVTGIDFSKGMLQKAEKKKKILSLNTITLLEMNIEKMTFEDNFFDTVVSTFVFCTVPNPLRGLHEVYRVLKPGGKVVFLEHMRSYHTVLNVSLYVMDVFSKALVGTSMIRETQKNIEKSGFIIGKVENVSFDIVRLIIAGK
jgi:ubiquinone/menaquinone biosynthesis C-methylase UbiE